MTGSKHVATVQGCPIRQLVDTKIIPYQTEKNANGAVVLTSEQEKDEQKYLNLLNKVLQCGFFYFSYDYDLTLSTQRIAAIRTDPSANSLPLWKRADSRFFWNRYLLSDLIDANADEFLVPLMNGYVFQQHQRIKQHDVTFVLISRRSSERTGRRFVTRGLDQEGHAANFAEAEQIIFVLPIDHGLIDSNSTRVASFLQTRGSIPVLWEQPVTLKYTPKIAFQIHGQSIGQSEEAKKKFEQATDAACRKHFETQVKFYGKQICINLVNQKGAELALVKAFKHHVDALGRSDVRLINWDFHQECRKMKYENISKLCELIKDDSESMGYFCAKVSSSTPSAATLSSSSHRRLGKVEWDISKRQNGVIRTNCIDCLDRTNVVQSVFARRVLDKQLLELTGFQASFEKHDSLDTMFRNVWANNADAMSFQYSGTGALKTDFTRTGKRSLKGACMDGINSMTRYYLNNFRDGTNQDAVDLFLGNYKPSLTQPSPFQQARQRSHPAHQKSMTSFAWTFTVALALLVVTITTLAPPEYTPHRDWSPTTQLLAFATMASVCGMKLLGRYGKDYANKPLLRGPHN